jgi:phosphate starvation-inducible protein PhoH and related proteins
MNKKNKPKKSNNTIIGSSLEKFHLKSLDLTEKQKDFLITALDDNTKVFFVSGPAGSSKTYISVYAALRMLSINKDLDLLYVRTIIESADKGLGALPGDLEDKFNPYIMPLMEKLSEILPSNTTAKNDLLQNGRIDAMPINFLRGTSWRNKIVIMDEAQNATYKELITLITRLGDNCKLFLCGDLMQSDINGKSGYGQMIDIFDDQESKKRGIHTFKFNNSDIKRSAILKYIISKLNKKNER